MPAPASQHYHRGVLCPWNLWSKSGSEEKTVAQKLKLSSPLLLCSAPYTTQTRGWCSIYMYIAHHFGMGWPRYYTRVVNERAAPISHSLWKIHVVIEINMEEWGGVWITWSHSNPLAEGWRSTLLLSPNMPPKYDDPRPRRLLQNPKTSSSPTFFSVFSFFIYPLAR